MSATLAPSLADRLRIATAPLHRQVESSPFVSALLGGRLARRGYTALLRNLHDIYAALEDGLERHVRHAAIAPVRDEALARRDAIARDLDTLHGPHWRHELPQVPGTLAFVQQLDRLAAEDPAALVAHAYVRYLGDLSGGQVVRRAVARLLASVGDEGLAFYAFDPARPVAAIAQTFRAGLDRVPGEHHDAIVAEALEAFRLHERLFADLAAQAGGEPQSPAEKLRIRP